MDKIASRYALALFELSEDQRIEAALLTQVKQLVKVFEEQPGFIQLLDKTQIPKAEKKQILKDVMLDIHPLLINTLSLLVDKQRSRLIPSVLVEYKHLYNQKYSILEAVAYTVTPLSEEDLKALQTVLSEKEHRTVELTNRLDPRLIKGIKIRYEDKVIDASMKTRIENLRDMLMEERA